ncbi:hypothetical protein CALVIDRAFT_601991 [Calocera viscosa TUFC12733]|uniref:Uncharacterized protein n=1 Tax=Calocera viscosa (strain TUFC12733) TaxID=1330018 RepID=A0A167HM71_CALVF|nr:hypothetical protein CALVIDRAFT_601991 [Calocera viscosa TUFC12733]
MPANRTSRRIQAASSATGRPTCCGFRLESAHDIILLLEACERFPESFPMLSHRINGEQYRSLICHGNVFVFEQQVGLARWTDCRRWMENQPMGLWLVYPEAVKVPKTNSYRQRINVHPDNPNRYVRPNLHAEIDGLVKRTVTVGVSATQACPRQRTLSIIVFVDPAREHELHPLEEHPDVVPTWPAHEGLLSKYQFKDDAPLESSTQTMRRRTRRHRHHRPKPAAPSFATPSLSPVRSLSEASSLSPVTPFPSLPPSYPMVAPWSQGRQCHTTLSLPPRYIQLAPLRWPMVDPMSARRTSLPPIHQVVGALMKPEDGEAHWPVESQCRVY